ncbi:DUF1361 domain-containing protein [Persicitalea jodogahamensis]|uniref:DUF1361 domain-containing protein n=1 Tax=Persicitalea jodogahamensis TaxID=402147 RepID=A0A8J3D688_9BACT|nr:DUF1361 domain-containing protein [Persicitalea jodogahamensis]GHB58525.1 hypothetical protein GCM10007390_10010 [Persicitalea jodogahamensis]
MPTRAQPPNKPFLSLANFLPLLLLAGLSLLALVFHWIRIQFNEAVDFSLDWNLFLSWIPLLIAFLARAVSKRFGRLPLVIALLSVCWLAFFPNAPYMITDLVHLSVDYNRDLTWHDAIMLFYYAQISLINGLVSLYWMHGSWRRTYSKSIGLVLLLISFPLGGFGVFLGRIVRLNSWDILHDTQSFFDDIWNSVYDRTALLLSVEFGLLLGTLYFVLWVLLRYRTRWLERSAR